MKRALAVILAASLMVSTCVGCSNGSSADSAGSGNSQNQASQTSATGSKAKIKFFHYKLEPTNAFSEVVTAFEKENPNIEVEMTAETSNTIFDTLKTKLASNDMPDVFSVRPGIAFMNDWSTSLEPLNDQPWVSSFSKNLLSEMSKGGNIYAAPLILEGFNMVYNKDYFDKAGIKKAPTTLTELKEACVKLKAANIQPFIACYQDKANLVNRMLTAAFAGHSNYSDYMKGLYKKATFVNDPLMNGFLNFLDLTKQYGNSDMLTASLNTIRSRFVAGEGAMMPGEGTWMQTINTQSKGKYKIGVMTMPLTDNVSDNDKIFTVPFSLGIYKQSPNKDAAKKFLNYMLTSDASMDYLTKTMKVIPGNTKAKYDSSTYGLSVEQYLPFFMNNKTAVYAGASFPNAATTDMYSSLQQYIAGKSTKDRCWTDIQNSWNKAINAQ